MLCWNVRAVMSGDDDGTDNIEGNGDPYSRISTIELGCA